MTSKGAISETSTPSWNKDAFCKGKMPFAKEETGHLFIHYNFYIIHYPLIR